MQTDDSLDYELGPRVELVVLADNGLQTAHCRVSISLLDVNDNAPVFEHGSYRTAVWEGQVHNTYIMQVGTRNQPLSLRKQLIKCVFYCICHVLCRCLRLMPTVGRMGRLSSPLFPVTITTRSSWTLFVGSWRPMCFWTVKSLRHTSTLS